MGTKTLVKLLIALVVIGAIAAVMHFAGSGGSVSEVASSTEKKKVFADFPINEVAKIVIQEKDGSVTLSKGAESWEVAEREGYPASAESVVGLLRKVWDLAIVQPITIGRTQYGRLGLLDPKASDTPADEAATLLTFQDKDGQDLATLWLGKVYERSEGRPDPFGGGMAKTDAGRYVKRGDSHSVYLVGETFSDVKTEAADWLDKEFFRVDKLQSIEISTGTKEDDWKLERADESADFVLANATPEEVLDNSKVASMRAAFSNPQIEDVFVGEEKGQQKTDRATFKISTFDGFRYEISIGEKNDLNELPLVLKVEADLPKERQAGEEESDEEKERLDKEFAERLETLQKKLEHEKKLEGHVFKVRSYIVDSITKKRSEILQEKKDEEEKTEEVAPGVSLPGLPSPGSAPKAEAAKQPAEPAASPAEAPAKTESAPEAKKEEAKKEEAKPATPEAAAPPQEPKAETAPAPSAEAKPSPSSERATPAEAKAAAPAEGAASAAPSAPSAAPQDAAGEKKEPAEAPPASQN